MPDSSKSRLKGVVPLALKDVTARCIDILKNVPLHRIADGFSFDKRIDAPLDEDSVAKGNRQTLKDELLGDKIIPQPETGEFVWDRSEGEQEKIKTRGRTVFPNYRCSILHMEALPNLVLVCLSNDLEIDKKNEYPRSIPFLFHVHPSPQDTLAKHKKLRAAKGLPAADADIVLFFQNVSAFPFEWDWLFFQLYLNTKKFLYQLRESNKPFMLVVPLIKSFSDGIGTLKLSDNMEKCLMGIQKYFFDHVIGPDKYWLPEIEWISLSSFSNANNIVNEFIALNRNNDFFRRVIREFIVLDPPPLNPSNRSRIVESVLSIIRANPRQTLQVYSQDSFYLNQAITYLNAKGVKVDFSKSYFFKDPSVPNVVLANLEQARWEGLGVEDRHNQIPLLFMTMALRENALAFGVFNDKKFPKY